MCLNLALGFGFLLAILMNPYMNLSNLLGFDLLLTKQVAAHLGIIWALDESRSPHCPTVDRVIQKKDTHASVSQDGGPMGTQGIYGVSRGLRASDWGL